LSFDAGPVRTPRLSARLLLAVVLASGGAAAASSAPKPSAGASGPSLVALLPAELRPEGKVIVAEASEERRAGLASHFAEAHGRRAERFLLAVCDRDASARVRSAILDALGKNPSPATRRSLTRHASEDPSLDVALVALERLRQQSARDLRRLLAGRLARAERKDDADELRRLLLEDERWISIERGAMLPSFLRQPLPRFEQPTSARSIHVLAFGDFGNGSEEQRKTAAAMLLAHQERPFDFGLTLGDNFYEAGMASPSDPRWTSQWEDLYGPIGIRFYPVLGNHDWKLSDSPAAEILYSGRSSSWTMPSLYYTFVAGPAQFFAIDTEEISPAELLWLREELDRSAARWKVVYGHHPIYSAGHHGDTASLVEKLLPVLRRRADVYLCGHDHDLQHLQEEDGVHFFVAGGGGAKTRAPHSDPRSLFAQAAHGFAVLDADDASLTVRFISEDSRELYTSTIRKPD